MKTYSDKSKRIGLPFLKMGRTHLSYILAIGLCLLPGLTSAITVGTVGELVDAVNKANTTGGDKEILLQDGDYALNSSALVILADGVTVRSVSGNRSTVIIHGDGMDGSVSHVFFVEGNNFTARDMTLRDVYYHAIQMDIDAQAPTLINLHILDTNQQMIKVPYDSNQPDIHSDNGWVENCRFEYSAGIGPQYYIGGVDAHHAFNWVVRGNTFVNIRSPDDPDDPNANVAEHAIHFWSGSRNTLVEKNTIINCDRGIGFGLGDRGHEDGIIRNNMIYHNAAHDMGDVGIGLESVTDAQVYNNTIYQDHPYPNAIEYRFSTTTGLLIANNLTNKAIAQRNEASAEVSNNITNALSAWFVNPAAGDLHLATLVPTVVNQGRAIAGLNDDIDGDTRPQGGGYDIGADEYESCPDCSGVEVTLDRAVFAKDTTCECEAEISMIIGTDVVVQAGATVTFTAPIVRITPGFRAENGAIVNIKQE